jgi:hypothetical protein
MLSGIAEGGAENGQDEAAVSAGVSAGGVEVVAVGGSVAEAARRIDGVYGADAV